MLTGLVTSCIGNCLLKHVIEVKITGRGRRRRRRKQLLDDLKEKRGYGKLKEEALDRTAWRNGFVVRQCDYYYYYY
jgi:hypothetical protein